jgi:hypothetical protein
VQQETDSIPENIRPGCISRTIGRFYEAGENVDLDVPPLVL